jgi:hypothetical protein
VAEKYCCCPEPEWELPPLILHPFADRGGAEKIQRAANVSSVLADSGSITVSDEELARRYLESRYSEFRMLCFIGKDIGRWIDQCVDFVRRTEDLSRSRIRPQSFADLLLQHPPKCVEAKLQAWGVADSRSIFIRAIGLHAIFPHAPEPEVVSDGFLRDYQQYAESLYACSQQIEPFPELADGRFHFGLFASGEYSQILEREWDE